MHQRQWIDAVLFRGRCFFRPIEFLSRFVQVESSGDQGFFEVLVSLLQHQIIAFEVKFLTIAQSMYRAGSDLQIDFGHRAMFALQYESFRQAHRNMVGGRSLQEIPLPFPHPIVRVLL